VVVVVVQADERDGLVFVAVGVERPAVGVPCNHLETFREGHDTFVLVSGSLEIAEISVNVNASWREVSCGTNRKSHDRWSREEQGGGLRSIQNGTD
jgi:hypothetical protein